MTVKFLVDLFPYLKKRPVEPPPIISQRKRRVARLDRAVDRLRARVDCTSLGAKGKARAEARLWRVLKRLEALEG